VIKAAPRSFILSVLTLSGFAWFLIDMRYSTQLAILHERISAYEQKLHGDSPDQAASEIKTLKDQIDALVHPPRASFPLDQIEDGTNSK
jgi:hypothetical protein